MSLLASYDSELVTLSAGGRVGYFERGQRDNRYHANVLDEELHEVHARRDLQDGEAQVQEEDEGEGEERQGRVDLEAEG